MWETALLLFALLASSLPPPSSCQTESAYDVCTDSFLCTEDFCSSCPPNCNKPDGSQCDGITVPLHDAVDDFCACCTYTCLQYLEEGDSCETVTNAKYPDEMCGPGLECRQMTGSSTPTCQTMASRCQAELTTYEQALEDGELGMNVSPPDCDDEGFYSPVQCYREGPCRKEELQCVDKEYGEPIFGYAGGESESEEDDQNCLCARNYYEALQQACKMTVPYYGFDFKEDYMSDLDSCLTEALAHSAIDNVFFSSHMRCLSNGNFDPLQCITGFQVEDMCFCLEESSLQLNSTRAYITSVDNLDCFDEDVHEMEYYRPCEKAMQAIKATRSEYESDGREFFSAWEPMCSPDGNFDKVQHNATRYSVKYCSDRDGVVIEDFWMRQGSEAAAQMNCECAYARRYLSEGVARPTCCDNGNYRGIQCQSGLCYCVDKWGRQEGLEVDQLEVDQLTDCTDWCYEEEEEEET